MCFHTSQTQKVVKLEHRFKVGLHDENLRAVFDTPQFHNNGFAHLESLIIPQEEPSQLISSIWGLAPAQKKASELKSYYQQQIKYGSGLNARSEKLFDYWLYQQAAMSRRCIIPVTGFFEPHSYQNKTYPIHIKAKNDAILGLAGIYTLVDNVVTYAILTKPASPFFHEIHNKKFRQPVILNSELEQTWLEDQLKQSDIEQVISECYDDASLEAYPVSKDLFNSRVDSNLPGILEHDLSNKLSF